MRAKVEQIIGREGTDKLSLFKLHAQTLVNRLIRKTKAHYEKPIDQCYHGIDEYKMKNAHTFFGYYDVIPFSGDDTKLLAMVTSSENHAISTKTDVRIGYFNQEKKNAFIPVGTSSTWCWQMGCRLQWHPEDPDRLIMYNTIVNGSYGATVQDVGTKKIENQYTIPIYAMDSKARWGLTVNFSRLHRLRPGYGYRNFPDASQSEKCPGNDGIWLIDLTSGKDELIIDLARLALLDSLPSMKNADHYVNHLEFNPSGDRFMFFHLWDDGQRQYGRLITSDLSGKNLYILEKEGKPSHYTWKSNTKLLATVHYGKAGVRYNMYVDGKGFKETIGNGLLDKDGHPSYSPNGDLILTDTYPDKYRDQHVLLFTTGGDLIDVAPFYSAPRFTGETRCDLHPRWNRTGTTICVDGVKDGSRSLYVIRLNNM